jgi:hypothetical protein
LSAVCFIDNDIILKLAACNFFWEAVSTLELSENDLQVLPEAKYVFQGSNKVKKKYGSIIVENAINIVERCGKIQLEDDDEEVQQLQQLQIEGIDPGEMLLICATRKETSFYLTTGDKRCLTALASHAELENVRQRLTGRVICLEQLILKLIKTQGFDKVLTNVLPARTYDTALKSIFGSGERATEENVLTSLEGYINDLQKNTKGLLIKL